MGTRDDLNLKSPIWGTSSWFIQALVILCYWMNFMDGVLTAYNLTRGDYETNPFMRTLWDASPLAFASGKFFLFLSGMLFIKNHTSDAESYRTILLGTLSVFLSINVWHIFLHI